MDMALVVGLGMDMVIVGEHRVFVMGPIMGIVSCWNPCNRIYSRLLIVNLSLDELK